MKRFLFLATALAGTALYLPAQQQTSTNPTSLDQQSTNAPALIDVNDRSGNVAMKGNAEIHSEIGMSLEDHMISGLQWKVTDRDIEISGAVHAKSEKQLALAIVQAYADGRKVHDHIKESSSLRR